MRTALRRYWFEFEGDMSSLPAGALLGCGVTAVSRDDALEILAGDVFHGPPAPIRSVIEDVDASKLDANHVRRNMGDPTLRGVWFPMGTARR